MTSRRILVLAIVTVLNLTSEVSWGRRRSVAVLHYTGSPSAGYTDFKDRVVRHAITHLINALKEDAKLANSEWIACVPDFASEAVDPTPVAAEFWSNHNTVLEVVYGEIDGDVSRTEMYVGDAGEQLGKRRLSMWLPINKQYLNDTRKAFAALTLFTLAMNASRAGDRVVAYLILLHARDEIPRLNRAGVNPPREFVEDFELLKKAINAQISAHQGPSS